MRIFEKQTFENLSNDLLIPWPFRKASYVIEDLEFHNCTFLNCALSLTHDVRKRTIVHRVTLSNCKERGCKLYPAIVEDMLIDNLSTHHLQSWGAVFKHVTLRGLIGPLMLSDMVTPAQPNSPLQRAFTEANAAYYTGVDWALDIREAEFENDVDLRGVPGHLIRRDPETQVLVTRAKALEGKWRNLKLERTYWPTAIEFFLKESHLDALVLVVPKHLKSSSLWPWTRQDLLNGLKLLREEGIAEPQ
jgi:hypothetical protein